MEIYNIPESFSNKLRLAIIASLVTAPKTFRELKELLSVTDGNLGGQLKKLEEYEIVKVVKEFVNKKPQTTYSLTEEGRLLFREYVELLADIVELGD